MNSFLINKVYKLLITTFLVLGVLLPVAAQETPTQEASRSADVRPASPDSLPPSVQNGGRDRSGFRGSRRGRRGLLGGGYRSNDSRDDSYYDEKWEMGFIKGEFAFVRLQYDNRFARGDFGFGFDTWATDYDAADRNFLRGVSRLTNIKVKPEPITLRLDNDEIFDYPFLYALEMGRGGVHFSEREMENLRQYLLRGGFMLIDDFWGTYQWQSFYQTFREVFPDRELVELKSDHEIFHVFYDIDGPQMIPALGRADHPQEEDIPYAYNYGILDDDGRVMVLINWNSDMGDGWEHTYHPAYPTKYANLAYRLGINYLMYALSH